MSPSEQSFEDPNRLTVEGQDCGDFLLTSFNAEPTNFASPPPRQCTPYTPILPMKRMRPTYLQTEDEAVSPYETVNLSSITHPNSIAVEQLIQSDQEAIIHRDHPLQPKSKRPKNRTTVASTSKPQLSFRLSQFIPDFMYACFDATGLLQYLPGVREVFSTVDQLNSAQT